jgi:hypothetical protein
MSKLLFSVFFVSLSLISSGVFSAEETKYQEEIISEKLFYMECQKIYPSQLRYSSKNVQEKIDQAVIAQDAVWNEEKKSWTLKYNEGKSALDLDEAVPVVKGPFGYVLTDGHHHLLASLQLGAKTVPVKVIADLSALDEKTFWQEMEQKGWSYPYNILGERSTPPKDFKQLLDDPNRYFAAIIARKSNAEGDLSISKGAEYPVWIKVGKDIPFIEFRISDALWKQGLRYNYDMGDQPPEQFVEEARRILRDAKIQGLRVVPEKKHYSELSLRD